MKEKNGVYTPDEFMAIVIAREVHNFETVGVGAASPIPAAGCLLAEELHAPQATVIILGSKEYHPFLGGSSELHFLAQRGELDLFFLSGLQIDSQGNINLHVLGDYQTPKMRLPGAYGSAMLYYMARRVILFRTEHTRRTLVEKVDFVTAPGITSARVYRPGGPTKVVTPKAILGWDSLRKNWYLESIHPGIELEDVLQNTGFNLNVSPSLAVTPPPSPEELQTLRTRVRPKLERIYPDFAQQKILS